MFLTRAEAVLPRNFAGSVLKQAVSISWITEVCIITLEAGVRLVTLRAPHLGHGGFRSVFVALNLEDLLTSTLSPVGP